MKSIDVKRNDRYVARELMRLVFLLGESHASAAEAVFVAFQRFRQFVSSQKPTFLLNNPGGDWDDFDDAATFVAAVRERLLSVPRDPNCSLIAISDDTNISDYSFTYSGYNLDEPDFKAWASNVVLSFPVKLFEANRASFEELFLDLLNSLPAFAGYASRSLEGDQEIIQKIAKRYQGLDISSVSSIAKDIDRKAPGSFWLNAYKGDLASVMLPLLTPDRMPDGVQVNSVGEREVLVMTSSEPSRLAVESSDSVDGYRWLARKLEEAERHHVPRRVIYFEDDDDLEDIDAQVAWHSRFL